MIYNFVVTTPANTPIEEPQISRVQLMKGLLYKFALYFPPGGSGLVGVSVYEASVQLYPYNRKNWFTGDNLMLAFDDLYNIVNDNQVFDILTYNLDTDYDHIIQLSLGIVDRPEHIASFVPDFSTDEIVSSIDNLTETVTKLSVKKPANNFSIFGVKRH